MSSSIAAPRRAVILAGGMGTRLRPYTVTIPKPLVPVGDRAILEILIEQLKQHGVERITLAVNHMAELVQAYFGDGRKWEVQIDYSLEDTPLSTIGPLTIIPDLPEHVLVMNGDLFTDIDFSALFAYHLQQKNDLTVAAYRRQQKVDFGVMDTDDNGSVIGFREKPIYSFLVSMGIYVLRSSVIASLECGQPYGFDDLMLDGIETGLRIGTYQFGGQWLDIGRPDDYEEANRLFLERG